MEWSTEKFVPHTQYSGSLEIGRPYLIALWIANSMPLFHCSSQFSFFELYPPLLGFVVLVILLFDFFLFLWKSFSLFLVYFFWFILPLLSCFMINSVSCFVRLVEFSYSASAIVTGLIIPIPHILAGRAIKFLRLSLTSCMSRVGRNSLLIVLSSACMC